MSELATRTWPGELADEQAQQVRVLYIGGMPRSGTTLLHLMLGQLPGHVAVGELFYLWQSGVQRNLSCGCGTAFADCPFWTAVGEQAFGGWGEVDLAEVAALVRDVDRSTRVPLLLRPGTRHGFARRVERYADLVGRLYQAIREVSGASVVVDSSKRPSLAYVLRRAPGVDLRVVHLLRDPRGVAYSWSRQVALPPGASVRGHLKVRSAREVGRRWLTVNAMVGALGMLGVPLAQVRYEDLVADPAAAMRLAARLTGTPLDEGALRFLAGGAVSVEPAHTVAGGRIRFQSGPITLRADEAWRTGMPWRRRAFVSALTAPLRGRYDYR